jgi:hypothetical protein
MFYYFVIIDVVMENGKEPPGVRCFPQDQVCCCVQGTQRYEPWPCTSFVGWTQSWEALGPQADH